MQNTIDKLHVQNEPHLLKYNNIMLNQLSQQISSIQPYYPSTSTSLPSQDPDYQRKQDFSSEYDNKWIQDFLSPSALIDYSPQNLKKAEDQKQVQIIQTAPQSKQQPKNIETPTKRRSIFHNFQKHLITLLKKIVYFRKVDITNNSCGALALELWKIFKERREFSKKSLYLVFGVNYTSDDSQIFNLAQIMPEFSKILNKNGTQEIYRAQALLRSIVIDQVSQLHKHTIQPQCKMGKFEQFYAYFTHFIEQLQGDGLCKRLKKKQKIKVMERKFELFH